MRAIQAALQASGLPRKLRHELSADASVNVILLGRKKMAELNRAFLGHEGATDVITFPLYMESECGSQTEPVLAGEVYVCLDIAVENADFFNKSLEYEVLLYIVHGFLHLLGLDDSTPSAAAAMRRAERRVMTAVEKRICLDGFFAAPERF